MKINNLQIRLFSSQAEGRGFESRIPLLLIIKELQRYLNLKSQHSSILIMSVISVFVGFFRLFCDQYCDQYCDQRLYLLEIPNYAMTSMEKYIWSQN